MLTHLEHNAHVWRRYTCCSLSNVDLMYHNKWACKLEKCQSSMWTTFIFCTHSHSCVTELTQTILPWVSVEHQSMCAVGLTVYVNCKNCYHGLCTCIYSKSVQYIWMAGCFFFFSIKCGNCVFEDMKLVSASLVFSLFSKSWMIVSHLSPTAFNTCFEPLCVTETAIDLSLSLRQISSFFYWYSISLSLLFPLFPSLPPLCLPLPPCCGLDWSAVSVSACSQNSPPTSCCELWGRTKVKQRSDVMCEQCV